MDLSCNQIVSFEKDNLINKDYLNKINLSQNLIKDASFVIKQIKLIFLNLSHQHIELFNASDWILLEELDISFNKISKIENINSLKILIKLNLSHNLLKSIDFKLFEKLLSLKTINLSHQNIEFIENNTFSNLPNLEEIDLSFNNLTMIKKEAFFILYKLSKLNLTGNGINSIQKEAMREISCLNELDLSKQKLELIQAKTFVNMKKLEKLDLSSNNLQSIEPDFCFNMDSTFNDSLKILLLANNQIQILNFFKRLINLELLDLNRNFVKEISSEDFLGVQIPIELDLSFNLISNITNTVHF